LGAADGAGKVDDLGTEDDGAGTEDDLGTEGDGRANIWAGGTFGLAAGDASGAGRASIETGNRLAGSGSAGSVIFSGTV
jgi:hypothetical protein